MWLIMQGKSSGISFTGKLNKIRSLRVDETVVADENELESSPFFTHCKKVLGNKAFRIKEEQSQSILEVVNLLNSEKIDELQAFEQIEFLTKRRK